MQFYQHEILQCLESRNIELTADKKYIAVNDAI